MVVAHELPFIQQGENLLISAQLLHKELKVPTRFYDWIKRRIEKYGFEDGQDFYSNLSKSRTKPSTDYLLTLDTAKELAMLEENEIGRDIRRYFIAKEKEARGISLLPREREAFKGLPRKRFNNRTMLPYRDALVRIGYSRNNNGGRAHRYWMHFIKEGNVLWVTEEFAAHLFHQKQVYANRAVMLASQPVLPFGWGDSSLLNQGGVA
ncbi:MAG: antA/AntB antirepressor family protein [Bacteroidetes bacterium]|nr:antA/AntB antirepressor family protein [Bacteroidota bacterium]